MADLVRMLADRGGMSSWRPENEASIRKRSFGTIRGISGIRLAG